MSGENVFGLFADVGRNDCLKAISLALLKVRASGVTCAELGKLIGCSADTVENASNERTLLNFDSIANLASHFPDAAPLIEGLWRGGVSEAPTVADRLERIERELDAIRREAA